MHFFPKADAALLSSTIDKHSLPPRPKAIGPIFDANNFKAPIEPWTSDVDSSFYPPKPDPFGPSSIPPEAHCASSSKYVRSRLAKNERLRLSMLWYYARDLDNEPELLAGLQEKACLAQESSGWEYAVVGVLDVNVYIRLATVGLQLAILPRGETLCAHTVTQPPGNVFLLPNMLQDWRFRESPYVEHGGLVAYAGVPLRMQHESGECVGLGSLCVASATGRDPLSKTQQLALARLADWIVHDIIQCARARRQRERHRFVELIAAVQQEPDGDDIQEPILRILRQAFPDESISLQSTGTDQSTVPYPATTSDLKHGLWEDDEYIEDFIANSNFDEPPKDRVVRFISAQCETKLGPSVLVVATKDFRRIFDDVDSWFVHTCATMLTQRWQKRLLTEVMRAKEKFLRGVSHQLRTPIHGILGAAELLTEDLRALTVPGSSTLRPGVEAMMKPLAELGKSSIYLDTISTAGRELMSTVNSMITLNRWADIAAAERQYATHGIESLETALVKALADFTFRDTRTRAPVFFHHNLTPDSEGLRIDINLFRDSILPLIVNAVQNTTKGVVTVTQSYTQDTKTLVVDVEDTGCGIPPEDQGRIFDLYEKVGEHSTGAGLGLTLATKFSALLHGSIELVSSEVNRGSHFRATFRDIRPSGSPPTEITTLQLKHLPLSYQHLPSDPPDVQLSSNLAKYLSRNGFSLSNDSQDCLNIIDYIRDSTEREKYHSRLPKGQVAICLVPNSDESDVPKSCTDIVFVNGPFSSSSLDSALQQADDLLARLRRSTRTSSQPSPAPVEDPKSLLTPPDPTTESDQTSTSDEGYDSVTSSSVALRTTEALLNESVAKAVSQIEAATIDLPIRPLIPPTTSKPMTLIVDDNAVNLRILEMYCKKRGLPYLSAIDGHQAVELFKKQQTSSPIDLILMDLQMPVCDGVSATRQIRALEKTSKSVLFIVTGQDSQMDREAASKAGADNYLVKPVGIRMLDSSLKRYFPDLVTS
ncbi:related to histidine kinase [Fusarium oxysporum]|uniref:histidine kinase n=1 Tax=Fusarium oxysporum TaxID=5507 RepID=A0A2H3THI5_FUSOX|nr:related to histidine kinase [Fusarium oxysporum]